MGLREKWEVLKARKGTVIQVDNSEEDKKANDTDSDSSRWVLLRVTLVVTAMMIRRRCPGRTC